MEHKAEFINELLVDIKLELEDRLPDKDIQTKLLWTANSIISNMITRKIREIHLEEI